MGIKITPKDNEPISITLKRLRKACEREGLIRDVRKHEFYEKPSIKRRRDRHRSISRMRQSEREAERPF